MNDNGPAGLVWAYAVEGNPAPMLQAALRALGRNGASPQPLPPCNGEACRWVRQVAECLTNGRCRAAVLFCADPCLACCVANKVPGVRAAAVGSVPQAGRAVKQLGANLLAVEMAGRTFFEFREILRLCQSACATPCPPGVACVLEELDGHAHR